jgi:ABC-type Fe3+-hydroxamate transport system substrate-binding protein
MQWWEQVYGSINVGDEFQTPGWGQKGNRSRPFVVLSKNPDRIIILSGKSRIPLEAPCFEAIEEALTSNPFLQLRAAPLHENQAFENSADKLIRKRTGSNLARSNYVCSILESIKLVRYAMVGNKKCIEINEIK